MANPARPRLVLGIETATPLGGVAVVSREGLLGATALRAAASHGERILPALAGLLPPLGLSLDALDAVAVSCGPGSFTGLRTGIASALGLAFALRVPLYGIPTLTALAANAPPGEDAVCAVVRARRGEVFRALFRIRAAGPEPAGPEEAVPLAEIADGLPDGCLLLGEVAPPPREAGGSGGRGLRLGPPHLRHPRAEVVAFLGLARLLAGDPSELGSLRPRYLRPPDAVACRGAATAKICVQ